LEIKQFSHETVSAYIDRFEARKLQAEDLGLPQNDIIVEDDDLTVKGQANSMAGFEAYFQVLESLPTEMRKENEKMMSLFEKMMKQRTSTPPSCLLLCSQVERPRIVCSHCGGVVHPVENCWKLHLEKRPAKLGAMAAEPSLILELKSILEKSERRIPDIVKGFLKDVVRKNWEL